MTHSMTCFRASVVLNGGAGGAGGGGASQPASISRLNGIKRRIVRMACPPNPNFACAALAPQASIVHTRDRARRASRRRGFFAAQQFNQIRQEQGQLAGQQGEIEVELFFLVVGVLVGFLPQNMQKRDAFDLQVFSQHK
jgi:hypothetical protein